MRTLGIASGLVWLEHGFQGDEARKGRKELAYGGILNFMTQVGHFGCHSKVMTGAQGQGKMGGYVWHILNM